jgi:transposase-like protein
MSVYRWIRKYSKLVKPYVDSFKVNGQDAHLHADEMMLQMNGEWVWLWNVISQENRFVLATRLSKTRDMNDAKALFDETKSKIDGLPMKITTDGMPAYPRAISHSFYRHAYPRVEHYVAPGITNAHQNNLVERHHNTIRARVKTMRGFHEMGSAADIMNLWNVYFNYLRPNMALNGKRPSESAGLGDRSLIALIEEAYDWNNRCKKSS